MAEGGVEKRSMRTVLGIEDEGLSTSEAYNLVVKDHGVKSGLKFESVCITPIVEKTTEELPDKTVQVLYTEDPKMQGRLKFATVAVCETPRVVSDSATVSKTVHLRSNKSGDSSDATPITRPCLGGQNAFASDPEALTCIRAGGGLMDAKEEEGTIFASDPDALSYIRFDSTKPKESDAVTEGDPEGEIFASDPEVFKFIRLGPRPAASSSRFAEAPEEVLASDPEALKYIRFGPVTKTPQSFKDEPTLFASDHEALKNIRFGTENEASTTSENEELNCVFASDPEALKWVKFAPTGTRGSENQDQETAVFASDPEALKWVKFAPTGTQRSEYPGAIPSSSVSKTPDAQDPEGDILGMATGIQLKDERLYSVRVTGHELPDGQQKKFVSVRSSDGQDRGPTREEMDRMQVTVETKVSEDGLVEKFVVVE